MGVLLFLFCRSTLVANSRNSRFGGVIGNLNSRLRGTGTHRYRIALARFFRCKTGTSRAESKKFPFDGKRRELAGVEPICLITGQATSEIVPLAPSKRRRSSARDSAIAARRKGA